MNYINEYPPFRPSRDTRTTLTPSAPGQGRAAASPPISGRKPGLFNPSLAASTQPSSYCPYNAHNQLSFNIPPFFFFLLSLNTSETYLWGQHLCPKRNSTQSIFPGVPGFSPRDKPRVGERRVPGAPRMCHPKGQAGSLHTELASPSQRGWGVGRENALQLGRVSII